MAITNGSAITFDGAVLATYERNGASDSDFCAIVWDANANVVRSVEYDSTRFAPSGARVTIDATPEVIEMATAWAVERWRQELTRRAEREAVQPSKGRRVRSTTTRGKNVGVEGVVMWFGKDGYKSDRWVTYYRVGIKVEGESKLRYLDAEKVEVISPEPIDADAIRERAEQCGRNNGFRSALECGLVSVMAD